MGKRTRGEGEKWEWKEERSNKRQGKVEDGIIIIIFFRFRCENLLVHTVIKHEDLFLKWNLPRNAATKSKLWNDYFSR